MITPTCIDHLVYRVASIPDTERFYTALLGAPAHRSDDTLVYMLGDTHLFFTPVPEQTKPDEDLGVRLPAVFPENENPPYDKDKIGLNHLAFGVRTLTELKTLETQLDTASIKHSGIKLDPHGQKDYIWLDDPNGFRIEFYLRTS